MQHSAKVKRKTRFGFTDWLLSGSRIQTMCKPPYVGCCVCACVAVCVCLCVSCTALTKCACTTLTKHHTALHRATAIQPVDPSE